MPCREPEVDMRKPSHNQPSYTIQKFGGTSLGKYSLNIVDNVIRPYSTTSKVVAVCSARSLDTKLGGTTNRLLRASRDACNPESKSFCALIHDIQSDHIEAIHGFIKCPHRVRHLTEDIKSECQQATALLAAAQTLGEITPKCLDRVVGTGERLSARVLSAVLQDRGISSEYVDLSDAVKFPVALPLEQEFYDRFAVRLGEVVQACSARVAVVTGYFGHVPCGLLNGVGRGYTDLCAALLAVGIPGAVLQVWKELDGIFTADPGRVRTARLLRTISPAEAAELTFYGSEVIHPLAMKQAVRNKISIMVKGVLNPQGLGTLVVPDQNEDEVKPPTKLLDSSNGEKTMHMSDTGLQCGHPIALTTKREIMIIRVQSTERYLSHSFFARVFATLEKWRLSVDLMSTSEVQVSMALYSKAPQVVGDTGDSHEIVNHDLFCAIQDLHHLGQVELVPDMAIVSIIGRQVRGTVGLAGNIFSTLGRNNIPIQMISQGASDISMSCVIKAKFVERAICILHERLFPATGKPV